MNDNPADVRTFGLSALHEFGVSGLRRGLNSELAAADAFGIPVEGVASSEILEEVVQAAMEVCGDRYPRRFSSIEEHIRWGPNIEAAGLRYKGPLRHRLQANIALAVSGAES